jgi:hypothetical protein
VLNVIRRSIQLLLVLAALLQASPARSCVIENAIVGENCHDDHQTAVIAAEAGVAGRELPADCGHHSKPCVCQVERHILAGAQQSIHDAAFLERTHDYPVIVTSLAVSFAHCEGFTTPIAPSLVCAPLLI